MCRKAQGSAFATNAPVRRKYFRLLSGADLICREGELGAYFAEV
jgi:hypothetical protein